jgi:DNA repair exonuclease SbcCD ATPase subunit
MRKKIILTESKLHKIVRNIVEQVEDEYYRISPNELTELLKLSGYHMQGVTKLPKFQGKKLWVTGSLNLSNRPIDSLGRIAYIDGTLDISRTKISDIDGVTVKGSVWDTDTPREAKREAKILREKRNEGEVRRANKEWDVEDADEIGLKANALFQYLIENGEISVLDDEEQQTLDNLQSQLESLEQQQKDYDTSNEDWQEVWDSLQERIEEVEQEIEDVGENDGDVYDIYPTKYKHYGLNQFEVLMGGFRNKEYSVGDYDEMEEAALVYAKQYIDEVGVDGFRDYFLQDNIDTDYLSDYVRDSYEDDVWQNPDVYFNDDDFELTDEEEARKEQLEEYIEKMEEEQSNLNDEIEDADEYSDRYDEIQNMIDKAQEELDNIEPDKEPTQEMVDRVVEDMVNDALRDPVRYIKDNGLDIKNFIDEDELAKALVDSDGWGIMNGYDGQYDEVTVNDTSYYVMRIN